MSTQLVKLSAGLQAYVWKDNLSPDLKLNIFAFWTKQAIWRCSCWCWLNCECHFITTVSHLFAFKQEKKRKSWILVYLGTHLLVSSSCWIFLCSSRLLALHADILQSDRRIGGWGGGAWKKRKVSHHNVSRCRIISLSFLSLPISIWMHECYLPLCLPASPSQPLLSLMFHFGHNESPSIMAPLTALNHHW